MITGIKERYTRQLTAMYAFTSMNYTDSQNQMLTQLVHYTKEVDSMKEHGLHLSSIATHLKTIADMQNFRSRVARFLDFSRKATNLDAVKSEISNLKCGLKYFSINFKSNEVYL